MIAAFVESLLRCRRGAKPRSTSRYGRRAVFKREPLRRFFGGFFGASPIGHGRFADGNRFRIVRHLKWGISHLFADSTGSDTLSTNADGFGGAIGSGRPNVLQVRQECPPGDTGYFRPNSAEIFRFTSGFDAISETASLSTNFTNTCHCNSPAQNSIEF